MKWLKIAEVCFCALTIAFISPSVSTKEAKNVNHTFLLAEVSSVAAVENWNFAGLHSRKSSKHFPLSKAIYSLGNNSMRVKVLTSTARLTLERESSMIFSFWT